MYDDHAQERRVPEPDKRPGRTAFQRDRARVLHSSALRRLAGKTQVVEPVGAHALAPRTRLTHSLECAQVGRELGAALGCDPDLVDTACLAHDLGHPPFGHNGELALDEAAKACGGFEGNAQSFRLLTRLEPKVEGAGLNLTRAALDAATKYPWTRNHRTKFGVYDDDVATFHWVRSGTPGERRCLESQVMDWADDVAYSVHDVEDAVAARLIDLGDLRAAEVCERAARDYSSLPARDLGTVLDDLTAQAWWPSSYDGTLADQGALKNLTSTLIGRFCTAAERATRTAYGEAPLTRYAADLVVPERERAEVAVLKAMAAVYVMDRPATRVLQVQERAVVRELVEGLSARPEQLEPAYRALWELADDDPARLRVVVDQVAALTDAAARGLHVRLAT